MIQQSSLEACRLTSSNGTYGGSETTSMFDMLKEEGKERELFNENDLEDEEEDTGDM